MRGLVTDRSSPRSETTLSGATGVRVGSTPRNWFFALGLAVVGGAAIAAAALQLADAGNGGGAEAPWDAAIVDAGSMPAAAASAPVAAP